MLKILGAKNLEIFLIKNTQNPASFGFWEFDFGFRILRLRKVGAQILVRNNSKTGTSKVRAAMLWGTRSSLVPPKGGYIRFRFSS